MRYILKSRVTNKKRLELLRRMKVEFEAHFRRGDVGDLSHIHKLQSLNQEFKDRARGKGRKR